ncbi:ATPase family AAA domain-containing protein 5-like isoform X2 [Phoenix dactylifera]|uniref:ATPase family AAA domain-containing protein 5-like isoform X2 n=1 Tax=Phoenix dactylifera TaxID=42345 RepID=A0A8B8ZLB4_PHODC|nr:ATPase family AAA domain-containing protein 5-like isoform X2 [Phoenix dactylifera]
MREAEDLENCSIKMALRECEIEKAHIECSCNVVENRRALTQVANKTLILFEDVDTVFDEDRGFISTILQLAETAKRPIILTSNDKNPILPQLLDRVTLEFKHPSSEELLSLVHMICASEKAQISAQLMEHLIRSCLGDIRKTLMLLQFWCQGKRDHTDWKMQFTTYSPLPFDIDAAHLI